MGNLGCRGLPRRWFFFSGTISCAALLFTIWDPVTGPGRTNAWKQVGLKPHLGIGRLGSEGFWVRNYGGGGLRVQAAFLAHAG